MKEYLKVKNRVKFSPFKATFTLGGKCCRRFEKSTSNKAEGGKCGSRLKKASFVLGDWGKCGLRLKKFAFTLAEVLIVLGIIGVVAALTIPNLIKHTQEQETVSQLQKVYTTLSEAYKSAENDYGIRSEERRVGKECRSRW